MATAQDDCGKLIPTQGAYQLITETGDKKVYGSAKDMYCSDEWSKSAQKSGWNFNIDATGYGSAAGGGNNASSFSSRAAFCSDNRADFSSSDKVTLYRLQGDAVLASAFVDCIKARRKVFTVSGNSLGDDATITVTPSLSQNALERIVMVGILSGAIPKKGLSISPGTPMVGTTSIVGGYILTAPQATFIIKTSTGDEQLIIKRCRTGTPAVSFEVKATIFATELQSTGVKVWNFPAPQAGCHPRCKLNKDLSDPEGGDYYVHYIKDNAILKNPRHQECQGGRCPFETNISAELLDSHQIRYTFRSRSVASTMFVAADTYVEKKVGVETSLAKGSIVWGTPFSIQIPNDATDAYLIYNDVILPLDSLSDGAPFKVLASKVKVGNKLVWTLRLDDQSCR